MRRAGGALSAPRGANAAADAERAGEERTPHAARAQGDRVLAPQAPQAHLQRLLAHQGDRQGRVRRGAPRAEEGHRPHLRHEDTAQEGHAAQGAGGARARRTRHTRRGRPPVGRQDVLLVPGLAQSLPGHGVSARRRHDDAPHQEGHVQRGHDPVLRGRDRIGHRLHPSTRLHTSRHQARQSPTRLQGPHQALRLRPLHRPQEGPHHRVLSRDHQSQHKHQLIGHV